jgi:hypothetical protein
LGAAACPVIILDVAPGIRRISGTRYAAPYRARTIGRCNFPDQDPMTTTLAIDIPRIRRALDADGFVIVPQLLGGGPVEALAAGIREIFAPHSRPGEHVLDACLRIGREDKGLLHRIHEFSSLAFCMNHMREFVFGIAKELLPNKGFYIDIDSNTIFSLPDDDRLTWRWHQESTYHPPMFDSVGFWFPIFAPATRLNGTMSVLKGTHKLGMLQYEKYKPTKETATSLVPVGIDDYVRRYEEVHCECDVGDVVIFDKHLIHRSNMNRDSRPRLTGLVRIGTTPAVPESLDLVY